jgi:hypothetical protein
MDDVFEEEQDAELFGSEDDDEEQRRRPKKRGRSKGKGKAAAGAGEEEEEHEDEKAEDIYANEGEDRLRPEMPDNVSWAGGGAGERVCGASGARGASGTDGAVLCMAAASGRSCGHGCAWPAGRAKTGATA